VSSSPSKIKIDDMLKRLKYLIIYLLVVIVGFIIRRLSSRSALRSGEKLGDFMSILIKKRRKIALSNLQLAFGKEKSKGEIRRIAVKCFENIGKNIIEFLRFPCLNSENLWDYVTMVGRENIEGGFERGHGVISFVPHFGNWELQALAYGVSWKRSAAIAIPLKGQYLDQLVESYRSRFGLKIIPKKSAIRQVIRLVRESYVVVFLADQDAGKNGIFIDFFGRPASFEKSPITLALRTNSSIVFSIDIRQPDDRHIIFIEPILVENTGNLEENIAFNTRKIVKKLEKYIRRYPSQWLWIHNRWKTQPE